MRLLSIDPSIAELGWAVIVDGELKDCGVIKTNSKQTLEERVKSITRSLAVIYWQTLPDVLVSESQYIDRLKGAGILKTVEVMGALEGMFIAFNIHGTIAHVHPKTVKSFLGLPYKAKRQEGKEASLAYVGKHYGYKTSNHNISDAILIGYSYLQSHEKEGGS